MVDVDEIQSDRVLPDADLTLRGRAQLDLLELQDLRSPERMNTNGVNHATSPSTSPEGRCLTNSGRKSREHNTRRGLQSRVRTSSRYAALRC